MLEFVRKSDLFLRFILVCLVLVAAIFFHARMKTGGHLIRLQQLGDLAGRLQLTDLCLTTEAWHTRNPSQADWHTPFQTHPLALEHFPSGAIVRPPDLMRKPHVD
jgi:hypothetical protein